MVYVLTADVLERIHAARRVGTPDARAAADTMQSWLAFVMGQASVPLDPRCADAWETIRNL